MHSLFAVLRSWMEALCLGNIRMMPLLFDSCLVCGLVLFGVDGTKSHFVCRRGKQTATTAPNALRNLRSSQSYPRLLEPRSGNEAVVQADRG